MSKQHKKHDYASTDISKNDHQDGSAPESQDKPVKAGKSTKNPAEAWETDEIMTDQPDGRSQSADEQDADMPGTAQEPGEQESVEESKQPKADERVYHPRTDPRNAKEARKNTELDSEQSKSSQSGQDSGQDSGKQSQDDSKSGSHTERESGSKGHQPARATQDRHEAKGSEHRSDKGKHAPRDQRQPRPSPKDSTKSGK